MRNTMEKGHVKFFHDGRGFGYICLESGQEIFVHYSAIESNGFQTLVAGEPVKVEVIDDEEKGPRASKVVRLSLN